MAKKETVYPWQQIEEQAFHAFREWPLWLVLRQRELAAQQIRNRTTAHPGSAAGVSLSTERPEGN
ncbi:MAG: hypothetical protein D6711_09205 [Chloroflexi bacterium]|nr:MAG: hypothetical protein D6711_09205 [Chloroflexota bacterium]